MWLIASAPSIEGLGMVVQYENRREELERKDFTNEIGTHDDILLISARSQGKTLSEYKKGIANERRKEELAKLQKEYGIDVEDDNPDSLINEKKHLIKHYSEIADQMMTNKETKKMENVHKFFSRPKGDGLKTDG